MLKQPRWQRGRPPERVPGGDLSLVGKFHPCDTRDVIHRGNWLWWLIGAAIFVAIVPVVIAIFSGLAWLVIYVISLWIHPFISCRTCSGTGRQGGSLFGYAHRQCGSCGGQGRHRRLGTTFVYRGRVTRAEDRAATARDSRRARPLP